MKKIFYSKNCIFTLILLPIVLAGIFGFGFLTFASGVPASIAIKVQPSINGSVDFPLSQQPVLLVIDSSGNPVSDATIVARASGTGNLNGGSAITDANGLATFSELSYDVTDAFTLTFFYIKNQRIKAVFNKSIQLSPGAVSPANSSISVSPSTVVADGQSIATIIVSCEDQYGNLIPGADVGVSVSGSDNTLAQPGAADKPGITTVNLSSTKAESKTVSVIVNNISIGKSDPINFVPGKIAKLLISADSPVDTNHTSQITITGKDQFDNVAINDSASQVALSVDNGGSLDPALATFAKGIAVASLSKKTPGTVNLVASDGNINATSKIVFNSADSIAPVILSQYPSGGVESVPLNVIPYINFSKTMDATTINNDSVQLRKFSDDSPVPATISIANGLKQARLQPDSNLDSNTKYYLYVDVSASDQSGNSLAFIYNGGSFTTIKIQDSGLTSQQATSATNTNVSSSVPIENNIIEDKQNSSETNASPENLPVNSSRTLNNASSSEAVINSTTGNTITTKSGTSKEGTLNYAPAGLLEVLKSFDINKFGDWFVENFVLIISCIIVISMGYIFWVAYVRDREI